MSEAEVLAWTGDLSDWMTDYLDDLPMAELDSPAKAIEAVRRSVPFIRQLENQVRAEVIDEAIVTSWERLRGRW